MARHLDDETARQILQDIHMLKDMHLHTQRATVAYLEDGDNPPHLPNALYAHCENLLRAIATAYDDPRNGNQQSHTLALEVLVHALLTGVTMGKAGIGLDDLAACECGKAKKGELTDKGLASFLDDSARKLKG